MSNMFRECLEFDQPIEKWDVSSVIYMGWILDNCKKFSGSLEDWNISSVKAIEYSFDRDILERGGKLPSWYNTEWPNNKWSNYKSKYITLK